MTICPGCNSLVASHDRDAKRFGGNHERCAKNKLGAILTEFPEINGRFRQQIAGATSIIQLKQVADDVLVALMQLPSSAVGTSVVRLDLWYEMFVQGGHMPTPAVRQGPENRRRAIEQIGIAPAQA